MAVGICYKDSTELAIQMTGTGQTNKQTTRMVRTLIASNIYLGTGAWLRREQSSNRSLEPMPALSLSNLINPISSQAINKTSLRVIFSWPFILLSYMRCRTMQDRWPLAACISHFMSYNFQMYHNYDCLFCLSNWHEILGHVNVQSEARVFACHVFQVKSFSDNSTCISFLYLQEWDNITD